MAVRRKVAVYTGNRAEYGLQYPIIRSLEECPDIEAFLIVSGAHLDEDFGLTRNEIERDGFTVFREALITQEGDSLFDTTKAIASGILSVADALHQLKPDFCIVYADRYEGLAAMIASTQMNIPTVHIEGGDVTEGGALDDSVRHAMTKLAHIHFTTNQEAARRVINLGEEPWRVHNVGFPALDLIVRGEFATEREIAERFFIDLDRPIVLFTQHSITTEVEDASSQVNGALDALIRLAGQGVQVVATYPNNDAGGKAIIRAMKSRELDKLENIQLHKSLGRYNYHGFLNVCGRVTNGACVGNSSSGIKETPAFGCPVVNIGSRQKGRLRAKNVLDVGYEQDEIVAACEKALHDKEFRELCRTAENPYGAGDSGSKIASVLSKIEINAALTQKKITY